MRKFLVALCATFAFCGMAHAAIHADPPGAGNRDATVTPGTYTGTVHKSSLGWGVVIDGAQNGYPDGTVIWIDHDDASLSDEEKKTLDVAATQKDADNSVTVAGAGPEQVTEVRASPQANSGDT